MSKELMLREETPVQLHLGEHGLIVKREDLACLPPGPPFSKTRGVYSHVEKRPEQLIGVLDTRHSQGGWAVARACQLLDKRCLVYFPGFKADFYSPKPAQVAAEGLDAELRMLPAGRSAILYHAAKKQLVAEGERLGLSTYMMPNALKLPESVEETAKEMARTDYVMTVKTVLVSASSATIASGVLLGLLRAGWRGNLVVHMGYSRSEDTTRAYMYKNAMTDEETLRQKGISVMIVDEGYGYADGARPGVEPSWPCNGYYDLKAFRWWVEHGRELYGVALFWNIG